MPKLLLPDCSNWILADQLVRRQYHKILHNRLANEHSVERVLMQSGKPSQVESSLFIEGKRIDAVVLTLCRDKFGGWIGKRQPAEGVFDGDLPGGDGAQVDLIVRIDEQLTRVVGEIGRIDDDP